MGEAIEYYNTYDNISSLLSYLDLMWGIAGKPDNEDWIEVALAQMKTKTNVMK